ncbi:glycosyl hydrolase family 28-related protein [Subtercola sp. RTI3]|uniref:glycosyl hydrolase family 28-related protein n=1 Tax=Subtercola sp. RTI3 TaxID=3048639 RepID=UPI002B233AD0|nr:glycosyl hydrolase family 28-related protein [Subtercola sp. RTI3]MEA9986303.1 hypothetical protein [Subtercola sp. RTI3]
MSGIAQLFADGAVPFSQVALRLPTVDPRQFGAKFDGVTDDTAAWLAAIASLPANGGTVVHPGGLSILSGELILKSYSTIMGFSPHSCKMQWANGFAGNFISSFSYGSATATDTGVSVVGIQVFKSSVGATNSTWIETTSVMTLAGQSIVCIFDSTGFPTSGSVWAGYQKVSYTGKNIVTTTLASAATAGATTITVASATGLAPSGGLLIDGVPVAYTSISGNVLTLFAASIGVPVGGFASGVTVAQHQLTGCTGNNATIATQATITLRGSKMHGIALNSHQGRIYDVYCFNTNGSNFMIDGGVENRIADSRATTAGHSNIYVSPGSTDGHMTNVVTGPAIQASVIVRGQNWNCTNLHPIGPYPYNASGPFKYMKQGFVIAAPGFILNGAELDTIPNTMFIIDSMMNGWNLSNTHLGRLSVLSAGGNVPAVQGVGSFVVFRTNSANGAGRVTVDQVDLSFASGYFALWNKQVKTRTATSTTFGSATTIQVVNAADFPPEGRVSVGGSTDVHYSGIIQRQDWLAVASTAGATQITLQDASAFPTSGYVAIQGGNYAYTGKTGNVLTGMSVATAYTVGQGVTQNFLTGVRGGSTTESGGTECTLLFPGGQALAYSNIHQPGSNFQARHDFIGTDAPYLTAGGSTLGGLRMESVGSSTFAVGSTTATVPHLLGGTPQAVVLTPTGAMQGITLSYTATTTTITVTASSAPSGSAVAFAWYAKILS